MIAKRTAQLPGRGSALAVSLEGNRFDGRATEVMPAAEQKVGTIIRQIQRESGHANHTREIP